MSRMFAGTEEDAFTLLDRTTDRSNRKHGNWKKRPFSAMAESIVIE